MAAWFLIAATSARLRGSLPYASATLEAFLLNTKMLLLFKNVQTEDVKGEGEEHQGALRRTGSLALRFGPAPGSWVILVLVPAGPLMPHFRVCMFLVQCSRGFRECSTVWTARGRMRDPAAALLGRTLISARLSLLCLWGKLPSSSARLWTETPNI